MSRAVFFMLSALAILACGDQGPRVLAPGYDPSGLRAELRDTYLDDPASLSAMLQTLDTRVQAPLALSDAAVDDLMAFLRALTDPAAANLDGVLPASVPSGLLVGE